MLGERLAESRKRAGLSQFEFAVNLDCDRTLISHVEAKRIGLSAEKWTRAATVLNVSIDYLAGLTDDPTPAAELLSESLPQRVIGQRTFDHRDALADRVIRTEPYAVPDGRPIAVSEFVGSAGGGAQDIDETEIGFVYFRGDWLEEHGLDPRRCIVIGIVGESMEPTLPEGCSILVDRNRRRRLAGHIFVVRTSDGVVVKRAAKDDRGRWQLRSDHPGFKPMRWERDAVTIGEVKWMAKTFG